MNCEEIAQKFDDDGYAIVRSVFSPQEIADIERQLDEVIRETVPRLAAGYVYYEDVPGNPIKAIHNLQQHAPYFERLAQDDRLQRIMQAIWPGAEFYARAVMFFGKAAYSGSVAPAHQDNAFQNLQPPEELVCTIAIDESTVENGALCVQRGSHRSGRLPHHPSGVMGFSQTLMTPLDLKLYPEAPLCMQPGDLCLHHTNTIHYSGPNKTNRSRRQLGIGYRTTRAQRDEAAWADYQSELTKLHAAQGAAT